MPCGPSWRAWSGTVRSGSRCEGRGGGGAGGGCRDEGGAWRGGEGRVEGMEWGGAGGGSDREG